MVFHFFPHSPQVQNRVTRAILLEMNFSRTPLRSSTMCDDLDEGSLREKKTGSHESKSAESRDTSRRRRIGIASEHAPQKTQRRL